VLIKREAAEGEAYAELSIFSGDTIARLAKRACTEFGWGVPTQMRLYLVPHVGKENPTAKAETLAKVLDKPAYSLADEGIVPGSWLLARVSGPATAAAPAENACDITATLQRMRLATAPLTRNQEASGFALDVHGFDEPVGWALAAATFLPLGRVGDEMDAAVAAVDAENPAHGDFDAFCARLHLENSLVVSRRTLTKVPEADVQLCWEDDMGRWWPDVSDASGSFSSRNARPEVLSTALVLGRSCKVDYCRKVLLSGGQASFIVAVGEIKSTLYNPLDGAPQALVAAFSAAADLLAKGLPAAQCVVPFVTYTGALEQHGVAYLLEPCFPCAVLTTPVLDLSDADGRRRIAVARWALRRMAEETTRLVRALAGPHARGASAAPRDPALDLSLYHIKPPLLFVGRSLEHSVLHQLRIFERLRRSPAAAHVVLPAAVLMRQPVEGAARRGGSPAVAWENSLAVAFPLLADFEAGVPVPGHPQRAAVLQALRAALRCLHRAGVVHLDLFSANILWRRSGRSGGGDPSGVDVEVRLIDFDASLECGQAVPEKAREIVERNGHRHSYDPQLFADGQVAQPAFDWWHFVLLVDDESPFGKGGADAAGKLDAWLSREGCIDRVRELVGKELAEEGKEVAL
jgi:hypothetical protein